MKKLLIAILITFSPSVIFAAGTCVPSGTDFTPGTIIRLPLTCTADAADAAGTAWTYTFSSIVMSHLDGSYIYRILINPGATGPTDNSDLALTDTDGNTPVSASSQGANVIDNATNSMIRTEDLANANWYYPVSEENTLTLAITNNSVNSAVTVITIYADQEPRP